MLMVLIITLILIILLGFRRVPSWLAVVVRGGGGVRRACVGVGCGKDRTNV